MCPVPFFGIQSPTLQHSTSVLPRLLFHNQKKLHLHCHAQSSPLTNDEDLTHHCRSCHHDHPGDRRSCRIRTLPDRLRRRRHGLLFSSRLHLRNYCSGCSSGCHRGMQLGIRHLLCNMSCNSVCSDTMINCMTGRKGSQSQFLLLTPLRWLGGYDREDRG